MTFASEHSREERFRLIGRDLFLSGAVSSHGGNLSESDGERIWITRRGTMLGQIGDDIVEVSLDKNVAPADNPFESEASREIVVHRAIYQALRDAEVWNVVETKAIVHAHTLHTIFRSMLTDEIRVEDSEARYVLGDSVPVFAFEQTIGSEDVATALAEAFGKGHTIGVIRAHGPFAIGETLDEAFYRISCLEAACKLLDLRDSTGKQFI